MPSPASVPSTVFRKNAICYARCRGRRLHLRRLLGLVRLYGRKEVLAAVRLALQYQTYDAAYVETGKSHLLNALGYTVCEKGISVRFTRVVDMINTLTTAQLNGTLERTLRHYTNPSVPFARTAHPSPLVLQGVPRTDRP